MARLEKLRAGSLPRLECAGVRDDRSEESSGVRDDRTICAKSSKGTWVISPRSLWEKAQFGSGPQLWNFATPCRIR